MFIHALKSITAYYSITLETGKLEGLCVGFIWGNVDLPQHFSQNLARNYREGLRKEETKDICIGLKVFVFLHFGSLTSRLISSDENLI